MAEVQIVLPAVDDDALSDALRLITAAIDQSRGEAGGFGLGGRSGYGAVWDSPVFAMHPYCWCERDECPWCATCECPTSAFHYFVDGVEVAFDEWRDFFDKVVTANIHNNRAEWDRQVEVCHERRTTSHDAECAHCLGNQHREHGAIAEASAPNFWHKPSGLRVWWYKYIGRGTETRGVGDVAAITAECLAEIQRLRKEGK